MEETRLKLDKLEDATLRLVEQVARLSEMIGEMSELRRQQHLLGQSQVATDSKAQIAMVNALAVQDDVNQLVPRLESLDKFAHEGVSFSSRRRFLTSTAFFIVLILITTYAAITGYQKYLDDCIRTTFLTETQATICDAIILGDEPIEPGPQYSTRLPPPPSSNAPDTTP